MNFSLRFWLTFSFSAVIVVCLMALILSIKTQNETNELELYIQQLLNARIKLLETNKLKEDIFISELINPTFYEQKNSLPERKFNVSLTNLRRQIKLLKKSEVTSKNKYKKELIEIENSVNAYSKSFNKLIRLFKLKGYKNYGIEGEMRLSAHEITLQKDEKIIYYSLILRKHEKDFLIRKELEYISSFSKTLNQLISYLFTNRNYTEKEKNTIYNLLYFYNKNFKTIARIENLIGFKGQKGLMNKSNLIFESVHEKLSRLEKKISIIEDQRKESVKKQSVMLFGVLIIFLSIVIYFLTKSITSSIKLITKTFTDYVNSGFSVMPNEYKRSHITEFNTIYLDFLKMAKEIDLFTNFFKEKVTERTLEINKQKEEILFQQQKIENQYQDLLKINDDLINQKELIKNRNTEMIESMRYAKRIQKALLPNSKAYKNYFKESFVYTQAKDVVSGDFNLIYPFKTHIEIDNKTKTENNILFIAADCTGHGVPGAFISVLGINSINKLVNLLNVTDPGQLLHSLDNDINHYLSVDKKEEKVILDGMDIAAFSFNTETYMLKYCLAKFSCALIRDGEFLELEAQKSSIGYNITSNFEKIFITASIQLKPNDCLYMFSDGYADQFGGPLNKKYKKRDLTNLMRTISVKPLKEQKMILTREFKDWKKTNSQTDDVSVIGVKF